jgi:putative DNA primase/helicase
MVSLPTHLRATAPLQVAQSMVEVALTLASLGYWVFLLKPDGKTPLIGKGQGGSGFHDATTDEAQIRRWWTQYPNANVGIATGLSGLVVPDLDVKLNENTGQRQDGPGEYAKLTAGLDLPEPVVVTTASGGFHHYYRGHVGSTAGIKDGVDVRSDGGYVVAPGSVVKGERYKGTLPRVEDLPEAPEALRALLVRKKPRATTTHGAVATSSGGLDGLREEARTMGEGSGRNDHLTKACGYLARVHRVESAYLAQALEFNALFAAPLGEDEATKTAESIWAKEQAKPTELPLDDSPLTEWVAEQLADKVCWSRGLGWMIFNGKTWAESSDVAVTELVRRTLGEAYKHEIDVCGDVNRLRRLAGLLSAGKIRSVAGLLRGVVEVNAAGFDCHPELLNVGNGVVNLRTGELLPHDRSLRLTKITEVNYRVGAKSADWNTLLTALPPEVADWMKVRFGQAVTGFIPPDDVLPILVGGGGNGKSSLVAAVEAALGSHARKVPERLLMARPSDHPTELTELLGVRVALAEETPESHGLNLKRLKDLLGTPTLTARKIAKDNITWAATHTLFLTTNHPPRVTTAERAVWRRLLLVRFPFTYKKHPVGPDELPVDEGLRDRLRLQTEHLEAVLAWVVEGAREWFNSTHTEVPEKVVKDTAEWQGESDVVGQFIEETLVFSTDHRILTADMLAAYQNWCEENGVEPLDQVTFASRMKVHQSFKDHKVEPPTKPTKSPKNVSHPDGRTEAVLKGAVKRVWTGVRFRGSEDDKDPGLPGV